MVRIVNELKNHNVQKKIVDNPTQMTRTFFLMNIKADFLNWSYISPWSYTHLWYRWAAEGVALLSPGLLRFHWLESHRKVWSQMSSAPKLLHLRGVRGRAGKRQCAQLPVTPNKQKKWVWLNVKTLQSPYSYVDKLAVSAEDGDSRVHFRAGAT